MFLFLFVSGKYRNAPVISIGGKMHDSVLGILRDFIETRTSLTISAFAIYFFPIIGSMSIGAQHNRVNSRYSGVICFLSVKNEPRKSGKISGSPLKVHELSMDMLIACVREA